MISGLSAELKDRRVDRLLDRYQIKPDRIFYSPTKLWFWWLGIFLLFTGFPLTFFFESLFVDKKLFLSCLLGVALYMAVGYLIVSSLNFSPVTSQGKVYFVNPNFPFNSIHSFDRQEIIQIKIGVARVPIYLYPFVIFNRNYIEVTTAFEDKRFYCLFLDQDAFDENMTELTLDDLSWYLQDMGIEVDDTELG